MSYSLFRCDTIFMRIIHVMNKVRLSISARILLVCAIVCIVTLSGAFFYISKRQESIYLKSIEDQSRIIFNQIILTRKWIADHGGIFVEKMPWVTENPYLEEKVTVDVKGKRYVKENPAMVTRQLSEYAKKQGYYWFHITSLDLVNPSNAPDEFERKALNEFESIGSNESFGVSAISGEKFFRFVSPLYIEASCLDCHKRHGYKIGDIRGAISVAIPLKAFYENLKSERIVMTLIAVMVVLVLLAGLFISLNKTIILPIRKLRDFVTEWTSESQIDASPSIEGEIGYMNSKEHVQSNEIDDLYYSFRKLHTIINSHHGQLKGKISEATGELSRINKELTVARDNYMNISQKKSEFIASISHELRTPMTSIKGSLGYIEERLQGIEDKTMFQQEILPFIEIMGRNINRVVKLVEDTLNIEKIEAGQIEFHFSDVNISSLLHEVHNEFQPIAAKDNITLELNVDIDAMVCADEDRLKQVVDNLINNAVKHSPSGSEIAIRGYMSDNRVVVEVEDSGPGIPKIDQEKVFERFYKGITGGTGLGLTISKGIIEGHDGKIGVESDGMTGSKFYFRLPVAEKNSGLFKRDSLIDKTSHG